MPRLQHFTPFKALQWHLHRSPNYLRQHYLPSTMPSPKDSSSNDAAERFSIAFRSDHALSNTSSRFATRAMLPAWSPRPASALFFTTPVQSNLDENLLALSQKVFASPKSPMATTSVESKLTHAQKQRVETNRQEAVRCQIYRLKEIVNEHHCMVKSPRTRSNRLLSVQVRKFYMDGKHYAAWLACGKFFL